MIKNKLFIAAAVWLFFASCHKGITAQALYGQWKYVKVENPNSSAADSVRRYELDAEDAHIEFSKSDSLLIWWGRRVLSHGTFKVDGDNIRFKEILPGGKTREFPFWVSKLTNKELIFETTGEDVSKVTAVKIKSF